MDCERGEREDTYADSRRRKLGGRGEEDDVRLSPSEDEFRGEIARCRKRVILIDG